MQAKSLIVAAALMAMTGTVRADDPRQPAPAGATVAIVEPADGATVTSPFTVKFGISGMGLAPAGTHAAHTGHHHLLIDTKLADPTQPIPADDHNKHFGKAQTETTVTLPPGKHTLQLVLGDGNHVPFKPSLESAVVTVTVK